MFFRAFAALSALIFCLLALLFLPDVGMQAARDALALCAQTVIPSLFPFFVLSSLLVSCGAADALSHLLSPLMRPLFGLSGTGAAALGLAVAIPALLGYNALLRINRYFSAELNRFARQLYGWFLTGLPAGSGMRDDKEGN